MFLLFSHFPNEIAFVFLRFNFRPVSEPKLVGWLFASVVGWLVGWSVVCLGGWLKVGWLAGWGLVGCLLGWLVGWLPGSVVG